MAVNDDLNRLAQMAVVYLTRQLTGQDSASTVVYRGRLHQATSGNWVFNTSVGTNGVAGLILGPESSGTWESFEGQPGGLVVTATFMLNAGGTVVDNAGLPIPGQRVVESITVREVIPPDLAE